MNKRQKQKKIIKPGKITRLKGKTRIEIENDKALYVIRAFKGSFG